MITLLKIYKKNIQRDGNTYDAAGAQPYAIYENGELHVLTETELLSTFANSGKVFVTDSFQPPKQQVYRLFEVNESTTFDESKYSSCKYTLGKEVLDIKLFEVIDLNETIEKEKYKIEESLRNGIYIPFVLSDYVIFRTADDYLIGPLKMEFSEGLYSCKEQEFIPFYQQVINITKILDGYNNHERLFCIDKLFQENLIGWIDIASKQRVISDALKQLKDNKDFAELSRKMIARLKEWYDSNNSQIPHLQERIKRAIRIMESHTLQDEEITLFNELVLDLEVTKALIEQRVRRLFEEEYEEFLKRNETLIKENKIEQQKLDNLTTTYINKSKDLEIIEKQTEEIQNTIQQKIKQLQNNFTSVYAEQLALSNLPTMTTQPVINSVQRGFVHFQSISGKTLSDINAFSNLLNENLSKFKGNDENGTLSATVLSAVILGEPLIIFGESSFELAKCIARTIACEQMLTVIPEIETFSLSELNEQYTKFTMSDVVKALIIHNPHTTGAQYSLPAYFKQNKWVHDSIIPDLTIISIDSLNEALTFIEKMSYVPIINSMDYISRFMNRRNFMSLQSGQLMLEQIEAHIVEQEQLSIRRDFREWIEDYKELDVEVPYQLVEWLNQINIFIPDEELFEWGYTIFNKAFKIKEEVTVGV